ncbi:hypothetical protein GCM10017752_59510 [Streptomyces roseoviridis]
MIAGGAFEPAGRGHGGRTGFPPDRGIRRRRRRGILSELSAVCSLSRLTGRRLNHRPERHPRNGLAFLALAAAICCYERPVRLTTPDTVLRCRVHTRSGKSSTMAGA